MNPRGFARPAIPTYTKARFGGPFAFPDSDDPRRESEDPLNPKHLTVAVLYALAEMEHGRAYALRLRGFTSAYRGFYLSA